MSSDGVKLLCGGRVYTTWTRYQVERDLLTPAATWTVEVADPADEDVATITEGTAIVLMVGKTILLRGWVDERQLSSSRDGGDRLSLSGRDLAGPLVDCNPPRSWSQKNTTLVDLARRVLAELGVTATVVAESPQASEAIRWAHAEPGETFWELLARLARARRCMIWVGASSLHIGRPDYTSEPVGDLQRATARPLSLANNVLGAEITWKVSGRRSHVTVLGQAEGPWDDAQLVGKAKDQELVDLGLYRPMVVDDGEIKSTSQARARARYEASKRRGEALVATYTVPGHGPKAGQVWTPNTRVNVFDERAGLQGVHWLAACSFGKDRGGTTTRLTLREDDAILPETP